jgi:hypothetical protein
VQAAFHAVHMGIEQVEGIQYFDQVAAAFIRDKHDSTPFSNRFF